MKKLYNWIKSKVKILITVRINTYGVSRYFPEYNDYICWVWPQNRRKKWLKLSSFNLGKQFKDLTAYDIFIARYRSAIKKVVRLRKLK